MPRWITEACVEYSSRFPRQITPELTEIPLFKRTKTYNPRTARDAEAERIIKALRDQERAIALDSRGLSLSTEEFAQRFAGWIEDGRDVAFLIGGPDGLSKSCLERAELKLSLSALTLPHGLARIVLLEQLYRAWSILNNHPYHR
ncbi:MAG: 23S rRNA (pseudouridine(1915)-N(3))-methyltransferase RlmH [Gammaproteobacteria bacterium]